MTAWEVQCYTTCEGWINTTTGDNGEPVRFDSEVEAKAELKELLHDLKDAVDSGDMEDYDPQQWRVWKVNICDTTKPISTSS